MADSSGSRVEFDRANHELACVLVYCLGRVVGGWQGDLER